MGWFDEQATDRRVETPPTRTGAPTSTAYGGGGSLASLSGGQATSAPASYAAGPADPRVAQLVQQYIQQNGLQANQSDPASLNAITQYLQTQGINAQTDYTDENGHTGGILVNGAPYQLIDGSNRWTSLQPWESGGGGAGAGGAGEYGSALAPWTKDFHAPTAEEALQTPGLQFAMDRAMNAVQRSAAAKGTLLTGGLLNKLGEQQTGQALQGYGDAYGRAMGEYGLQRENFFANQDRPFGKLSSLANLGLGATNAVGNYGTSYANNATDLITGSGNAQAAGTAANGNIWGQTIPNLANLGADVYGQRNQTPTTQRQPWYPTALNGIGSYY